MDPKALYKFTYGLYLLTTRENGKDNGCIINTAIQVANEPTRISVAAIRGNKTCEMIQSSGVFNISAITTTAKFDLFQRFGMQSGRDVDKFAGFDGVERSENGLYYLTEHANMYMSATVTEQHDLGSHILFIGEVTDGQVLSEETGCTYGYYQSDIKPKPRKTEKKQWVCSVCGYVYEGEEVPDDYLCPLCKHGKEDFQLVGGEAAKTETTPTPVAAGKKWVCTVCGYVHTGDSAPDSCPVCHVPADKFIEQVGEMKLAAEHEYGVYGKTVKNNPDISEEDKAYILEQLKANFDAECSEVGMYLCMARIAHREGYPEIGLYWEKAAWEEAEHAAKFAELLGEELEPNMKASTKENLAWRVECEFGATLGKVELATCAKKNNLDAIHDTVHEMARDEARHGKALKGLHDRYF